MKNKLSIYRPVITVLAICALTAAAISLDHTHWRWVGWMHYFMGMVFVVFSLFKLMNLQGFVEGLRKYDFIAQRFAGYAMIFPFIELILGLSYIMYGPLLMLNVLTFAFTALNSFSVIHALRKGLDVRCACLGTAFDIPLSSVSIIENAMMAVMAMAVIMGA